MNFRAVGLLLSSSKYRIITDLPPADFCLARLPAEVLLVPAISFLPSKALNGLLVICNPRSNAGLAGYHLCAQKIFQRSTRESRAQGITTFTASGDDGSRDDPENLSKQLVNVDYPSSSPYAFGCGGTTITPK